MMLFVIILKLLLFSCIVSNVFTITVDDLNRITRSDDAYLLGEKLTVEKQFYDAADAYWKAILLIEHTNNPKYTLQEIFAKFMKSFDIQGKLEEAHSYVAKHYFVRSEQTGGIQYLKQSLEIKPTSESVLLIYNIKDKAEKLKLMNIAASHRLGRKDDTVLSSLAHLYFEMSDFQESLDFFEKAYDINSNNLDAFSSAVYLRSRVCDWGFNGTTYIEDMKELESIIHAEMKANNYNQKTVSQDGSMHGDGYTLSNAEVITNASVIHPHAALGFPLDPLLKLYVAKSHADAEKQMAYKSGMAGLRRNDYYTRQVLNQYRKQSMKPKFRIKIGYVSASLKSKALIYLSKSLITFHNKDLFEVHLYSVSPPDNEMFLKYTMRGVDWRQDLVNDAEYFHDVVGMDMAQLCQLIRSHDIHILINWDGYSHTGLRATGLFPLQVAPIQVSHQEYLGTLGADYVQYLVTDRLVSPMEYESHYTEKFIYMPYAFFMNSCSYQKPHLGWPTHADPSQSKQRKDFKKKFTSEKNSKLKNIDFVFCNFNKHLKFNPTLFNIWLDILAGTTKQNTILLLLENPADSLENIREYIDNYNTMRSEENPKFVPLVSDRVVFLDFIGNPYDNQERVRTLCDVLVDTPNYNSHTTAVDALWGGVPLIALGNDNTMAGRVTSSILHTLNVTELVAKDYADYYRIAVNLVNDRKRHADLRRRIVDTCLVENDRNPFWNMKLYAKNLEYGYTEVWRNYLNGNLPKHIDVKDQRYIKEKFKFNFDFEVDVDVNSKSSAIIDDEEEDDDDDQEEEEEYNADEYFEDDDQDEEDEDEFGTEEDYGDDDEEEEEEEIKVKNKNIKEEQVTSASVKEKAKTTSTKKVSIVVEDDIYGDENDIELDY